MKIEVSCVESRVQPFHLNFMNKVPRDPDGSPGFNSARRKWDLRQKTQEKNSYDLLPHVGPVET